MKYFLYFFIFNFIIPFLVELNAQTSDGSDNRIFGLSTDTSKANITSMSFDKSFNTYHWTGNAFYHKILGSMQILMSEQFLSTLIKTDRKLITDNQNFNLKLRYKLSKNFYAASDIGSFVLTDNKSFGGSISKASSHVFYSGFAFQPFEQLIVEPLLGFRMDNQIDQQDNGFSYKLGLITNEWNYYGYMTSLQGLFQYDQVKPRRLETYNAMLKIKKVFLEQTQNYFHLNYYHNRRDFYIHADSNIQRQYNIKYNIESRTDNTISVIDSLNYIVGNKMSWTFYGNILTRDIIRNARYIYLNDLLHSPLNTKVNELKIEGGLRMFYNFSNRLKSSLVFSYQERDEKHRLDLVSESIFINQLGKIEEIKNNNIRKTNLSGAILWSASVSDTISISASTNLLHYDTPSLDNDDDRDELWYLLNLNTTHRINNQLTLKSSLDLNLVHLVYLFSTRSADNNWNRIIRFSPTIIYSPINDIKSTNSFEVLANYNVYDFEFLSLQPRSYVFRQFGFIDSTSFYLTRCVKLEWFGHLRLYERGELNWGSFSERPINYFEDKTMIASIRYSISKSLLFSLGFRYFNQLRFNYVENKIKLDHFLRSTGPMTGIEIMKTSMTLLIQGWYEALRQSNQSPRIITTMLIYLNISI